MRRKKTWGKPEQVIMRQPLRYLLKKYRESAGLTRQELGERSGTGVDRVIAVETRGEGCTITELHAWARVLGIQTMTLVG